MFDFETPVSRTGTSAEKYTALKRLYGREDLLPFWVADMEFATAPAVSKALWQRADHPVYGYTSIPESLIMEIQAWNKKRYGLEIQSEAVTLIPGVMSGVSAAISALTRPDDVIVLQPPLYPPLIHSVSRNARKLIENHLVVRDGSYCMDMEGLARIVQQQRPKLLLLCSPHNPVGRVWNTKELEDVAELTRRHGVYVVSDEIHADIVFKPHVHTSFLTLNPNFNEKVIVLNSASKTFNIAGLNSAYAIIPDPALRTAFRRQLRCMNLHGVNLFGMTALETAYAKGEEWLEELLIYLDGNRQFMEEKLNAELPGLHHFTPEGTYLYWLDFNTLGLAPLEIREKLINRARVALNDGKTFSPFHEGFWRFNFAVPRSMLEQGLERIVRAFQ